MRTILLVMIAIVVLAACSTPKYTYFFDHYDYNSGRKSVTRELPSSGQAPAPLLAMDEKTLVASANEENVIVAETKAPLTRAEAIEKFKSLSKHEKREVKKEIKRYGKESRRVEATSGKSGLTGDLKLAAIFGVIGIVFLIIGGDALAVIGTVALLIGLFFFVRWLLNN